MNRRIVMLPCLVLAFATQAQPPPGELQSRETNQAQAIGEALVIEVDDQVVLRMTGPISSAGRSQEPLVKQGLGELHLDGANDYNGETLLREGALRLSGSHPLGRRMLRAEPGTALHYEPGLYIANGLQLGNPAGAPGFVHWGVVSGEAVHAGLLQGTADFEKHGAGRLRLAGDALAYSGTGHVHEGALAIDEFYSGAVRIYRGAVLEGTGTAGSVHVHAGGILSPGRSPGTLNIAGDLRMDPDSWLHVDVAPDGRADLLRVGGHALLDGHVLARAQPGAWDPTTSYTILEAEEGLAGTRFSSVQTDLAFLDPVLSHGEHAVVLTLVRNERPLEEAAETPAAGEVGAILDREPGPLHDHIVVQDKDAAAALLSQLSGSWAASIQSSLMEDSRFLREAVHAQASPAPGQTAAWARFFHSAAERGREQGVPGDERRITGLIIGVRRPLGKAWSAGVYLGADHATLERDASLASAARNTGHIGVEALGEWERWRLNAGGAYSRHRIQSTRHVGKGAAGHALYAGYQATTQQLFAEVAVKTRIQPFGRLAWVHNRIATFTEDGGPGALAVSAARATVLYSTLGLRLSETVATPAGPAIVHVQGAWRHAGGDTHVETRQFLSRSLGRTPFDATGLPIARRAWSLELGASAPLFARSQLGIFYAGQFAGGRQDHGLRAGLGWSF